MRSEIAIVPILAGKVDREAGIEPGESGARRRVVKQTGVPAIVGERTAGERPKKAAAKFSDDAPFPTIRKELKNDAIQISSFEKGSKRAPVPLTQCFSVERIKERIVPAFFNHPPEILLWKQQENDRSERSARAGRSADDLIRKLRFVIDQKLRIQLQCN